MTDRPKQPFYALPGFFPDAIPFAFRTALSLVIAYGIGFYAQIPTASSAGVTVGIIAQPSTGMALSKAFYRTVGTLIGCVVAIVFGAAFGQDRTMLLLAFALWMGLCSCAAALLRDFRSYGAAISGYTVAIIAIGDIDSPNGLLLASLNRTAAILLGIAAVALVNSLFGGRPALDGLLDRLREEREKVVDFAVEALEGKPIDDDLTVTRRVANITGLQTDASYTAAERPDGARRRRGAQVAIGSLLTIISASRTVAAVQSDDTAPPVRAFLRDVAAALRDGTEPPRRPEPNDPSEALLIERADAILIRVADADRGIAVLSGERAPLPDVVLQPTVDIPTAIISGVRTMIAFGLTASFAVLAGWPGATLMLTQQAAFVGLLGASPTPTTASVGFILPLLPIALVVGLAEFLLLPLSDGFVPFALVVGVVMFAAGMLVRNKALAKFSAAAFIYVTLLLSPSNPQQFELDTYLNTVMQVLLATLFTLLTFLLIFPVSPKRRLFRVIAAVAGDLRMTRRSRRVPVSPAVAQARLYDRLVRALTFLGEPTKSRQALLSHVYRLGSADIALSRARTGLAELAGTEAASPALQRAATALDQLDFPAMLDAARMLLAVPGLWERLGARQAVSGLTDLAYLEGPAHRTTRFFRLVMG